MNFGSYYFDEDDGFQTDIVEKRSMPYNNNFWNAITYELSLNRREYHRRVYNFLDFLGDLGGLMAIIGKIFFPFVAILTYRGDMHMLLLDNQHHEAEIEGIRKSKSTKDVDSRSGKCCAVCLFNLKVRLRCKKRCSKESK